ncbi:alpha/beta hydrolase family protein (plasmid) [Acinetobacter baumannii]|nr:alpha/beta hydrolase family protein [Acinetobacter baumannii]
MNNDFIVTAKDGYPLAAIKYSAKKPKANIILAGATGVPQAFYRRFSEYVVTQGYNVITFDYRGIGRSKPTDFKNFDSNFLEWATLDLAAVVDIVADDLPLLWWVIHSVDMPLVYYRIIIRLSVFIYLVQVQAGMVICQKLKQ